MQNLNNKEAISLRMIGELGHKKRRGTQLIDLRYWKYRGTISEPTPKA